MNTSKNAVIDEQVKKLRLEKKKWSSHCGLAVTNPTSIHEDVGLISGRAQGHWFKDPVLL